MKLRNQKAGFTLIEMIIAVAIFSLVLIVATNIYLIINNSQRKIVTLQKIQEDVRFLFDAIAQDIRLSSINYDYYQDNSIGLHPDRSGFENNLLALIDQSGEQIFYRFNDTSNNLQYCSGECSITNPDVWENITPEQVEIRNAKFIISPSADPFVEVEHTPCINNGQCDDSGYMCESSGYCEYYTDGNNFQPKVMFSIHSRGIGSTIAEESELIMQTTISTRIFPGQVKNSNYDL